MLNEFRCKKCNKLLAKISNYSEVEVKCNRCKNMNYYHLIVLKQDTDTQPKPALCTNNLSNN